jgi:hypothetical protein
MKIKKRLSLIVTQLGSLFASFAAFGTNLPLLPKENVDSKTAAYVNEEEDFEDVLLSLNQNQINLEALENYMKAMELNYEITGFDGDLINIKMPHKDRIVLAVQIETAN